MIRKYLPVLLISFLVLLILVSQGNFVYGREVRGVTKDKIKIGLVVDHTGPLAGDIGLPITEAARIYTRHINDNGGILGRKLELIAEDDRYSIPAGIAAFKKLIYKDNILALIGPGSVGGVKALFGKIHKLKVPTLPIAPDKTMVKPFKRYIFMPFSVYGDQVGVFCDYILHDLKSKKPKITYVSFDVASGKAVLADTKEWAAFFNLDLNSEVINAGSLDATSQVMSLKIKKPTHIIIHHGVMGAVLLLRELNKYGLNIPVFGTSPTCSDLIVTMAGIGSKNYIGASTFSTWYDTMDGVAKMREITLKYKPGTEKPYRSQIYTAGWIMATVLYEGIKRAGKDLNSESLVTALETINKMDTKGLCPLVSFSKTERKGSDQSKLYKGDPKSGKLLPISSWRKPPSMK